MIYPRPGFSLAECACGVRYMTRRPELPCPACRNQGSEVQGGRDCKHRGAAVVRQVPCGCGQRGKMADVFACSVHGECVLRRAKAGDGLRCCLTCKDRQAESLPQDAPGVEREAHAGG